MPDAWQSLTDRWIKDAHDFVQDRRRELGLAPWEFKLVNESCLMCRDEGRPNVPAHYKGTPAAMSHTGKAIPPLCYDHRNGKISKPQQQQQEPEEEQEQELEEDNIFDGQDGPEPLSFDKNEAVHLYNSGLTWKEVAKRLKVAYHRVYGQCRRLVEDRASVPTKWEDLFKQIAPIEVRERITVSLPEGGTRAQLNSVANMNKLVSRWKWSFQDNFDGTVTCTKLEPWPSYEDIMNKRVQEVDGHFEPDTKQETKQETKLEVKITDPLPLAPPAWPQVEVDPIETEVIVPSKKLKLRIYRFNTQASVEIENLSFEEVVELLGIMQALK